MVRRSSLQHVGCFGGEIRTLSTSTTWLKKWDRSLLDRGGQILTNTIVLDNFAQVTNPLSLIKIILITWIEARLKVKSKPLPCHLEKCHLIRG